MAAGSRVPASQLAAWGLPSGRGRHAPRRAGGAPENVVPEARQKTSCRRRARRRRAGGAPEDVVREARQKTSCRRRARRRRAGGAPENVVPEARQKTSCGRRARKRGAGGAPEDVVREARQKTWCRRRARKRGAGGAPENVVPEAHQKTERTPSFSGLLAPGRLSSRLQQDGPLGWHSCRSPAKMSPIWPGCLAWRWPTENWTTWPPSST